MWQNKKYWAGVFNGAEFKNGHYLVLRPLLHCILARFLSQVSLISQIVAGWIFGNVAPEYHNIDSILPTVYKRYSQQNFEWVKNKPDDDSVEKKCNLKV